MPPLIPDPVITMIHPSQYERLSPQEAIAIQNELRGDITLEPLSHPVGLIGGADISFNKFSEIVYAGIVLLQFPELRVVHTESVVSRTRFPYIPGLLAFREVPALYEVWEKLPQKPDVLVLDGHGIAHPRRMGIAAHFGVVARSPTIGCAKSVLVGKYEEPEDRPGATQPLVYQQEEIGTVLRTKKKCLPVYVSPGYGITMSESVDLIIKCTRNYRIPEPTRLAHLLVNQTRQEHMDMEK